MELTTGLLIGVGLFLGILDLLWAFATRSRVSTRRGARGDKPAGYLNGSGALCSLLFSSSHFWNSSAGWTMTNPRIR